jgi:formyl-CoA transferase
MRAKLPFGALNMAALSGLRILDFTHIQSGPFCTQHLAWLGADVIKVERPGIGDMTRSQLRDIPDVDSLYFTMLNHNKRSIEIDTKSETGRAVLTRLIEECDVLVENYAPGAMDRMGFGWAACHAINPRLIMGSVKGFGPGPYEDCKVYENVAQCVGGSAATTGFADGVPLVTAAQIGDAGTGMHLALGILAAVIQRETTGKGQLVEVAMQDAVLNLCRVKMRDQQRLERLGKLPEYSQASRGEPFGDTTPRAGNDSGGGQPGRTLKCAGWEDDPNAYIYFVIQTAAWEGVCDLIERPEWKTDPTTATIEARVQRLDEIFATIESWTMQRSKFEVMEKANGHKIPVGPVLSMKELAEEPSLYESGTMVRLPHPERGEYRSVGCAIKMGDSHVDVERSPLLGEHTQEILRDVLGYSDADAALATASGALGKERAAN